MQERATGPTATWHFFLQKSLVYGDNDGVVDNGAELIVAGDFNGDLLRMGKVAVAMLGFRTSLHTFPL